MVGYRLMFGDRRSDTPRPLTRQRGVSLCFWSSGQGGLLVVEGAVSEHGVDYVAAAAGQADDCGAVFDVRKREVLT